MENCTTIRVRYAETDQMGVVYNGNYFTWFEVGRVEFLRSLGIRYLDLEKIGIYTAVAEAYCKYIRPAKYDDEVVICTKIRKLTDIRLEFEYSLFRKEDNQILAKGYTVHAFVDENVKPINLRKKHEKLWNIFKENI